MTEELTSRCKSFSFFRLAEQQEIKKKPHTWQHLLHLDVQQEHLDKAKSEVFFPNHFSDNFIMTQILCSLTVLCAHSSGSFLECLTLHLF